MYASPFAYDRNVFDDLSTTPGKFRGSDGVRTFRKYFRLPVQTLESAATFSNVLDALEFGAGFRVLGDNRHDSFVYRNYRNFPANDTHPLLHLASSLRDRLLEQRVASLDGMSLIPRRHDRVYEHDSLFPFLSYLLELDIVVVEYPTAGRKIKRIDFYPADQLLDIIRAHHEKFQFGMKNTRAVVLEKLDCLFAAVHHALGDWKRQHVIHASPLDDTVNVHSFFPLTQGLLMLEIRRTKRASTFDVIELSETHIPRNPDVRKTHFLSHVFNQRRLLHATPEFAKNGTKAAIPMRMAIETRPHDNELTVVVKAKNLLETYDHTHERYIVSNGFHYVCTRLLFGSFLDFARSVVREGGLGVHERTRKFTYVTVRRKIHKDAELCVQGLHDVESPAMLLSFICLTRVRNVLVRHSDVARMAREYAADPGLCELLQTHLKHYHQHFRGVPIGPGTVRWQMALQNLNEMSIAAVNIAQALQQRLPLQNLPFTELFNAAMLSLRDQNDPVNRIQEVTTELEHHFRDRDVHQNLAVAPPEAQPMDAPVAREQAYPLEELGEPVAGRDGGNEVVANEDQQSAGNMDRVGGVDGVGDYDDMGSVAGIDGIGDLGDMGSVGGMDAIGDYDGMGSVGGIDAMRDQDDIGDRARMPLFPQSQTPAGPAEARQDGPVALAAARAAAAVTQRRNEPLVLLDPFGAQSHADAVQGPQYIREAIARAISSMDLQRFDPQTAKEAVRMKVRPVVLEYTQRHGMDMAATAAAMATSHDLVDAAVQEEFQRMNQNSGQANAMRANAAATNVNEVVNQAILEAESQRLDNNTTRDFVVLTARAAARNSAMNEQLTPPQAAARVQQAEQDAHAALSSRIADQHPVRVENTRNYTGEGLQRDAPSTERMEEGMEAEAMIDDGQREAQDENELRDEEEGHGEDELGDEEEGHDEDESQNGQEAQVEHQGVDDSTRPRPLMCPSQLQSLAIKEIEDVHGRFQIETKKPLFHNLQGQSFVSLLKTTMNEVLAAEQFWISKYTCPVHTKVTYMNDKDEPLASASKVNAEFHGQQPFTARYFRYHELMHTSRQTPKYVYTELVLGFEANVANLSDIFHGFFLASCLASAVSRASTPCFDQTDFVFPRVLGIRGSDVYLHSIGNGLTLQQIRNMPENHGATRHAMPERSKTPVMAMLLNGGADAIDEIVLNIPEGVSLSTRRIVVATKEFAPEETVGYVAGDLYSIEHIDDLDHVVSHPTDKNYIFGIPNMRKRLRGRTNTHSFPRSLLLQCRVVANRNEANVIAEPAELVTVPADENVPSQEVNGYICFASRAIRKDEVLSIFFPPPNGADKNLATEHVISRDFDTILSTRISRELGYMMAFLHHNGITMGGNVRLDTILHESRRVSYPDFIRNELMLLDWSRAHLWTSAHSTERVYEEAVNDINNLWRSVRTTLPERSSKVFEESFLQTYADFSTTIRRIDIREPLLPPVYDPGNENKGWQKHFPTYRFEKLRRDHPRLNLPDVIKGKAFEYWSAAERVFCKAHRAIPVFKTYPLLENIRPLVPLLHGERHQQYWMRGSESMVFEMGFLVFNIDPKNKSDALRPRVMKTTTKVLRLIKVRHDAEEHVVSIIAELQDFARLALRSTELNLDGQVVHATIPAVFAHGMHPRHARPTGVQNIRYGFQIIERLPGQPLRAIAKQENFTDMDARQLGKCCRIALVALGRLHSQGFMHRDLHSSNIIVERDSSRVGIIDFDHGYYVEEEHRVDHATRDFLYTVARLLNIRSDPPSSSMPEGTFAMEDESLGKVLRAVRVREATRPMADEDLRSIISYLGPAYAGGGRLARQVYTSLNLKTIRISTIRRQAKLPQSQ